MHSGLNVKESTFYPLECSFVPTPKGGSVRWVRAGGFLVIGVLHADDVQSRNQQLIDLVLLIPLNGQAKMVGLR